MQKSLPLLTAPVYAAPVYITIFCLVLAETAFGQPRPVDSTPLDFVPQQEVQEIPPPQSQQSHPAQPPVVMNSIPPSIDARFEAGPDISPNAEKWRYVWYGGRWWYRQPTNRWSYWSEGRWVDYVSPARGNTPPYVQPPPPARRRWQIGAGAPYYRYPNAPGPAYPGGGSPYPNGRY